MSSLLRDYIKLLSEDMGRVQIHPDYMKKERVRQAIQDIIVSMVNDGQIKSPADLENFFSSSTMSLKALEMVPFDVFSKLAKG